MAYASRALSPVEKRYGITELETLAVVCHCRAYLYGHDVVVYTDHSAVRAVTGVTETKRETCSLVEQGLWMWYEVTTDPVPSRP